MALDEDSLWDDFHEFCDAEGIGIEDEAEWGPWWRCFVAGARSATGTTDQEGQVPAS